MRRGALVGAALIAIGSLPAAAHVVLTRAEVPADAEVELAMRAPVEREGTTNRKIYALIPGPFAVTGCQVPSAVWTCSMDTTTRPGSTFITWETPVAGSPQDLRFEFSVRTPDSKDAGEYKFPVVQTYSDGHAARWIQDGEPSPAPRLRVVPSGQPVSTAEPSPPPDASAPAVAPKPSRSGSAAPSRSAAASASTSRAAVASSASASAGAESSYPEASASASDDVTDNADLEAARDDEGGAALPIAAGVAALLAAAAGAAVVVRRRAP